MKYCEKLKRKLQREKEKARKEEAMETLQERQKAEALKRMAILKLLPEVSAAFEQGIVYYSERQNAIFDGILYFVNNEKKYVDIVKAFESEHEALESLPKMAVYPEHTKQSKRKKDKIISQIEAA